MKYKTKKSNIACFHLHVDLNLESVTHQEASSLLTSSHMTCSYYKDAGEKVYQQSYTDLNHKNCNKN